MPSRLRSMVGVGLAVCGAIASVFWISHGQGRESSGRLEAVWGEKGFSDGRLIKPRGAAIDAQDRLYIVDFTGRIQLFDAEGHYLFGWRTPVWEKGKPTGITISRDGRVLVPDTHYHRVLIYSAKGDLLATIGGTLGHEPGQFGYVTDVAEDDDGYLYVSEYGDHDRIQKFTPEGRFVLQWGSHGTEPGQFMRPQSMEFDRQGRLFVTDACNHRIQVFDSEGKRLDMWGEHGSEPGQLNYPYGLAFGRDGALYVCEYGNSRVQKFTPEGRPLGTWGTPGRRAGELWNPWAVVVDSRGRVYTIDSTNHRVQRITL